MKYEANVLHLSATPLVAAPGKISTALNRFTRFRSTCILASDYPPPLARLFTDDAILLREGAPSESIAIRCIESADIVHVHNNVPEHLIRLLLQHARSSCRYVYQLHSTYREGPLYFPRHDQIGVEFSAHLTIPHFPQRAEPGFRIVPNIVLAPPSAQPIQDGELPRILFSPSHRRTGQRWGDKVSERLTEVLQAVASLRLAAVHELSGVHPLELFEFRRTTHISIDEIVTGAFHQVSLEALATGNVVVNGADFFQCATLQSLCRSEDPPPFFRVTEDDVHERLPQLLRDLSEVRRLQRASVDFFQEHLRPEKLISHFTDVYEEISQI